MEEAPMKRTFNCCTAAAMLILAGALSAHADNDIWTNTRKQQRGDFELHADADVCAQQFGTPQNGKPTSMQFKRCMSGHGWRFVKTQREETWVDPDTGLQCHKIDFFGVPGSSCSNF